MFGRRKRVKEKDPGLARNLFTLSTLGINLVASTGIGVLIGWYLDKWLTTRPVMTIVFFCVGTFAGFRQIYMEIRKLGREDGKTHDERR